MAIDFVSNKCPAGLMGNNLTEDVFKSARKLLLQRLAFLLVV